ncbi:MAG TPA: hypothetical protein EYQ32_13290 [Gammaproteobacteria bacterium]|nr:hypothetical protein [Gammaproteobacteria bacterium]
MKKQIVFSLLCGMFSVAGVFGIINTAWANEEQSLTLPDGLFEGSSNFELRYESGSLDPMSLNGSALGVEFFEAGEAFGHAEKVSIASTGTLTGADLVVKELIIDGLVLGDKDGDRLAVDTLKMVSSGTWDGGNLVIDNVEMEGLNAESGSTNISIRTLLMKSLPVAELMAAGEKLSNAAEKYGGFDPEALQRGYRGPKDIEKLVGSLTALNDIAGLLDGFDLTLNQIQWTDDVQSGSLGRVTFGIRDGFWLPEFSAEGLKIDPGGEIGVEMEAVRFNLEGSLASRLSALFEIVGLALRPGETAPQTVREFFETLDREEVVVDFGTQLITTVEQEETLAEIKVAFGVPELMGLKLEFASRSPVNPIAFLGSSKFTALTQEERQAAIEEITTQGQLDHAQLTLTNWNAIDIFLKTYAQQSGQSEEQLRMTGETMINMFVGRGTPALAEASDALVAFLKTPGTLQASFRPPKPQPAPDTPEFNALVANPAALVEALGLSVKFLDEPMSIESHRLTQTEGLTGSNNAGISAKGLPEALPPIPDSNVLDWLSARRAYAEEDYETVLRLMVPHAEAGTESAQRVVAHAYRKTNQFEQAAPWYQGLAEKGDAASQFYLGMLYQKGLGVEQDNEVALEWLEKATAQGDARAIHALALSTQTIEVVKEINSGLSARAQEVLTDVVRHYYDADDPSGIHFAGKRDVLIPTALWDRIIVRWRAEGVMPSHGILQAVAGEHAGNEPATESATVATESASSESQGTTTGTIPFTDANGDDGIYTGQLIKGIPYGQGTWTDADGNEYVGGWKAGLSHGQGTFTEVDGCKYVGEWRDDDFNGQGALTCPGSDGFQSVGEFKDGELWNGKYIDADDVVYTVSNGEEVK